MNGYPLEVWFVNVGHGDSTIVRFPPPSNRVMMVDINNSKILDPKSRWEILESIGVTGSRLASCKVGIDATTENEKAALRRYEDLLEDPVDVLKQWVFRSERGDVFRFIITHPHLDHLGGIYRLSRQEPGIDIVNLWDTANTRSISKSERDKMSDDDKLNWDEYQRIRKSGTNARVLNLLRGAKGDYYTPDGICVLSPTQSIVDEANQRNTYDGWNHLSYMLYITYGSSSLILPGDASIATQEDVVSAFGDGLSAVVLKAPHHGRESGYCEDFARQVYPDYTIVSVGKKPESDASNKYKKYTRERVLSTRMQGTMYLRMYQDGSLELYNHKSERLDQNEDLKQQASWQSPYGRF